MTTAIIIIAIVYVLDSKIVNGLVKGLTGRDTATWAEIIGLTFTVLFRQTR